MYATLHHIVAALSDSSQQVLVGSQRAILRRGENIKMAQDGPQKGVLVPVPLFHVTGSTSLSVRIAIYIKSLCCHTEFALDDG